MFKGDKSGLAHVVRMGTGALEIFDEELSVPGQTSVHLDGFVAVFPMGLDGGLHAYFRGCSDDIAKSEFPFLQVKHLVTSEVDAVKHIPDHRVAWDWRLRKAAELTNQSIKIKVCHFLLTRRIKQSIRVLG